MQSSYKMELPVLIGGLAGLSPQMKATGELLAAELILRHPIQEILERKKNGLGRQEVRRAKDKHNEI